MIDRDERKIGEKHLFIIVYNKIIANHGLLKCTNITHYSSDAVLNIFDRMLGPNVWTYFDAAIKTKRKEILIYLM